ncbi:MAG: hypothetical protein HC877_01155 [Thioploca sp.]|nr:hypothetical protein [Thioploca sp.]
MITEMTKGLIKATLFVLKQQGDAITTRMYELLFEKYSQVKPLFANAPDNQSKILTQSIIAYSEHIDDLSALSSALEQIARKHVAVGIQPEYYPLVGESLLQAFREILDESMTDEIISAWQEAYFFLAEQLIQREQELIAQQQT